MKIKYFLQIFCALAIFCSASVIAQSTPDNSSTPPPSAPAVHVGSNNPYKIGTAEDPVIAVEYCAFLNTYAGSDSYWYPVHYDPSFIRVPNSFAVNRQACILRSGDSGHYAYTVIQGHEQNIIDGLQSEQVQKEFTAWRQNPKVTELCEFMNAQISGDVDTANAIKNKYPASTCDVFDQLTTYAHNYVFYSMYSMHTEYTSCAVCYRIHSGPKSVIYIYKSVSMSPDLVDAYLAESLFFTDLGTISTVPPDGFNKSGQFSGELSAITQRQAVLLTPVVSDELSHAVLTKGYHPDHPAVVYPGRDYYRPSQITSMDHHHAYMRRMFSLPLGIKPTN